MYDCGSGMNKPVKEKKYNISNNAAINSKREHPPPPAPRTNPWQFFEVVKSSAQGKNFLQKHVPGANNTYPQGAF